MTKIYIHHYYTEHLFYFLAHNTTDRVFNIQNNLGFVKCKYKNTDFEFVFKSELSEEMDGYHLMDWTTIHSQLLIDKKLKPLTESNINISIEIDNSENNTLNNLVELLKDKSNWILTFFCGEKSLYKYENVNIKNINLLKNMELSLCNLHKCKIIFEEYFLKKEIEQLYKIFFYAFSNTVWFWNNRAEIRWFFEFNKIYEKHIFDYKMGYSVRAHKYNRIELLKELKALNRTDLYLQRSDERKHSTDYQKYKIKVPNIYLNLFEGENDFDNLKMLNSQKDRAERGIFSLDLFFRLLPKAKMHILDESWGWSPNNFASHYLSEKTIGFILAGIPFISTHSYPLEIIEKLLEVEPHPFLEESKKIQGNTKLIANFVNDFLDNFELNYKKCKEWTDLVRNKFITKLNTENSLLDLILNDFTKKEISIKKIL